MITSSLKMAILKQIESLETQLQRCENAKDMLPLMEEFLETLYYITGNWKTGKAFINIVNARLIALGCNPKLNRFRTGPVGSGKVANSKEQRNLERKLNEAFSI